MEENWFVTDHGGGKRGNAEYAKPKEWLRARWNFILSVADADNTKKNHTTGQRAFVRFMLAFGEEPVVPVSDEDLAMFYVFQSQTCKVSTLKSYTTGVRRLHLEAKFEWVPVSHRFQVAQTMRGLKRLLGDEVKQKLAITLFILARMYQVMNFIDCNMVTLWAAMLTALLCLLRKDNVCVGKVDAFNVRRVLRRKDFEMRNETVWVTLVFSKVIQFEERTHRVAMRATGGMLCPRRALAKCFELTPAEPESPAFLWKSRGRTVPMTHGVFVGEVKKLIRKIGLDPSQYSGHSFRRGGATMAFNLGVDHLLIKLQGDWVSNAYQRYEQLTEARRLELPKRLAARMKQVECIHT
ncbi:hypothetical protein CYMTET_11608 [Cymbomonas tetramitiformis]|uniref:Tyr recombinase domain-containing protein n=1 Tax=Cymbomonas tetramitiformis TaxID=36881 RepID=A0AAE0LCV1_9CHLO|nr:hypothetical protein CYMTET_11608 [Cymbomonas tetramitiformis]